MSERETLPSKKRLFRSGPIRAQFQDTCITIEADTENGEAEVCLDMVEARDLRDWITSLLGDHETKVALVPRFKIGDTVRVAGGGQPRKVLGMFVRYQVETSDLKGWVCVDDDGLEASPEKTSGGST